MTRDVELAQAAVAGDSSALSELFEKHRPQLSQAVRIRMNPQLQARLGVSDIIQEIFLEISKGLAEFVRDPVVPFYVWLRRIAGQKLVDAHRFHARTAMRDVRQEVSLEKAAVVRSAPLAEFLAGTLTSPSVAAVRNELRRHLRKLLESMDDLDRELLTLRHFEQLSNRDAAAVLGITSSAASTRYVRALQKLRGLLDGSMGI